MSAMMLSSVTSDTTTMLIKSCEITKLLRLFSYPELRLIFYDIYGNLEKKVKQKGDVSKLRKFRSPEVRKFCQMYKYLIIR